MSSSSPKISFDVQRPAAPKADPALAVQDHEDDAVTVSTYDLPLPPVFASSKPDPEPEFNETVQDVEPEREEEPKLMAPRESKPFRRPQPKPPQFAATGLMAHQQGGFFKRNAMVLGVSGGIVFTFLLGLMTAFALFGDRETQQFSQPLAPEAETATRSIVPDMTDVSAVNDIDAIAMSSATQSALAQSVLAGLTPAAQLASQDTLGRTDLMGHTLLNSIKLRQLREGVLAGLYNVVVAEKDGARQVQLETINIDMSAGYEEDLLIEAAQNGLLELSGALRTSEGGLDTKTMIFDVVQRSLIADDTTASSDAALDMSRKVFAASIARTQFVNGERVYTVQPGDSLAYIAMQFFGMPGEYQRILDANPNTLQSPEKIQIGQRLVIPS